MAVILVPFNSMLIIVDYWVYMILILFTRVTHSVITRATHSVSG